MGQAEGRCLVTADACRRYVTERSGDWPPAGALEYPPGQDVWGSVPVGSVAGQDSVAVSVEWGSGNAKDAWQGVTAKYVAEEDSRRHMVRRR